jgi:DNA topoisomerase-1
MNLVLVESPGKKATITKILSEIRPHETWRVEATLGHVCDLPSKGKEEGDITTGVKSDLTLRYETTERGAKVVKWLKDLVAKANNIYIASDLDREGEAIAWHIQRILKIQNYKRIVFNEINHKAIEKALNSPRKIDMQQVDSQQARRALDRLVGYLVSQELRRQHGTTLSAGRVQSPAVLIIVMREIARQKFKPVTHYSTRLYFNDEKTGTWFADWLKEPNFVSESNPYILDRNFVLPLANLKELSVESFEEVERKRNPPAPFTTSTMQQASLNALGFGPKETMALAQKLYEAGHITYMRTDNPNVSEESMPAIKTALAALNVKAVETQRKFKAKGEAQEAHSGVTPTHWEVACAGETPEEQALYKLIRMRALASQAEHAVFKVRKVLLGAPGETLDGKPIHFGAAGETLVRPGFLTLLVKDDTEEEQEAEQKNPIPELQNGDKTQVSQSEITESTTKAPSRFTEASLIKELERHGIGRPATYAAILENIIARNYIAHENGGKSKFLEPTQLGISLIKSLAGKFKFLDLRYTNMMEQELDAIASNKSSYASVVEKLYTQLANELNSLQSIPSFIKQETVHPCENCGKPMRRFDKSAHGPFWGCTGHPECSHTLPDSSGKPGKRKAAAEVSEFKCGKCGKGLVHRVKKGKNGYDFWGCSGFAQGCTQKYQTVKGQNVPDLSKSATSAKSA